MRATPPPSSSNTGQIASPSVSQTATNSNYPNRQITRAGLSLTARTSHKAARHYHRGVIHLALLQPYCSWYRSTQLWSFFSFHFSYNLYQHKLLRWGTSAATVRAWGCGEFDGSGLKWQLQWWPWSPGLTDPDISLQRCPGSVIITQLRGTLKKKISQKDSSCCGLVESSTQKWWEYNILTTTCKQNKSGQLLAC